MKTAIVLIVLLGILVAIAHFQFDIFTPAPARAYKEHRNVASKNAKKRTFTEPYWLQTWNLKIDSCTPKDGYTEVYATQKSYWMPLNAASLNFANIVTEKFYAEMELKDGRWVMVYEEVLSESVSTPADRQ